MNKKYGKFLTIILIIVTVLVIGLLIFFAVDAIRKFNINNSADGAIDAFNNQYVNTEVGNETNSTSNLVIIGESGLKNPYDYMNLGDDEGINGSGSGNDEGMYYQGFLMVGYIEIPKTRNKISGFK